MNEIRTEMKKLMEAVTSMSESPLSDDSFGFTNRRDAVRAGQKLQKQLGADFRKVEKTLQAISNYERELSKFSKFDNETDFSDLHEELEQLHYKIEEELISIYSI